ncbi:MAG: hypothetical protein COV48_15635, partial [Elusimicrobia bacterium CG11_big_fil_rev_8_21_14_0_20_64_6]
MNIPVSNTRRTSYALLALVFFIVARFNLGPCVLSGLVSFMIMDLTERRLRDRGIGLRPARWAALAAFAVLATLLSWIFIMFVRVAVSRLPVLLDTMLPRLTALSVEYG